jgi:hypothetical protein
VGHPVESSLLVPALNCTLPIICTGITVMYMVISQSLPYFNHGHGMADVVAACHDVYIDYLARCPSMNFSLRTRVPSAYYLLSYAHGYLSIKPFLLLRFLRIAGRSFTIAWLRLYCSQSPEPEITSAVHACRPKLCIVDQLLAAIFRRQDLVFRNKQSDHRLRLCYGNAPPRTDARSEAEG